jgi:hypothetical protein
MPHIVSQKIVDWQQNSGGEIETLLFTHSIPVNSGREPIWVRPQLAPKNAAQN